MTEPLPFSAEELAKLLRDPETLVRRLTLSFALERPRRIFMRRRLPKSSRPPKRGDPPAREE